MKIEKHYNQEDLLSQFYEFKYKKQSIILYDAIDYMQQYNGRTRLTCIFMAMGYKNYEGENNTWTKN
tara:strand:- start:3018 stop:3218 length:201 start_codon:yes stop_codon:yes gene_type:complete